VRTPEEEQALAEAEAVARVAAAKAASIAPPHETSALAAPVVQPPPAALVPRRRVRIETTPDEDDPRNDPTAEDGRFA
jgi:hypothetical protein